MEEESFQLFSDSLSVHCHWASSRTAREPHATEATTVLGYWMFLVAHEGSYAGRLDGSTRFGARAGEVVCIPPGIGFSLRFVEPGVLSGAAVSVSVLGGLDLLDFFELPAVIVGRAGEAAASALTAYAERAVAMHDWDFRALARLHRLAHGFLDQLLGVAELDSAGRPRIDGALRLLPAISYVWQHAGSDIRRADLARLLGIGEQHLHVLFRTYLGIAPYRYIQRVRLSKAQVELVSRDDTVRSIAERLGFCDQFHFSRQFKKEFGISPAAYRDRKRRFLAGIRG